MFQHPPQARHLAGVFVRLSERKTQVLICTHSPLLVGGRTFEDVRLVRRRSGSASSEVTCTTFEALKTILENARHHPPKNVAGVRVRLETALNPAVNELFFSPVLVLVEGLEDAAYLGAELEVTGKVSEFRRLGCNIVPAAGKDRLPQLQAIAQLLGVPTFTIFDGDDAICGGTEPEEPARKKKWQSDRPRHEQDNAAILHLALGPGHGLPAMPTGTVWRPNLVQWHDNIRTAVADDVGVDVMRKAEDAVRADEGIVEREVSKNPMFVGLIVERLHRDGTPPKVLTRAIDAILEFAASTRTAVADAAPTIVS